MMLNNFIFMYASTLMSSHTIKVVLMSISVKIELTIVICRLDILGPFLKIIYLSTINLKS